MRGGLSSRPGISFINNIIYHILTMMPRYYHQIRYWNLDTNSGWHHVSDTGEMRVWLLVLVITSHCAGSNPENGQGRMVSMTPYSAFMLGAATNTYGTNLANFWVYNPENYKFEDIKRCVC